MNIELTRHIVQPIKAFGQSSKWRERVWRPSRPLGRGIQTITTHWRKIVLTNEKETAVVEVFIISAFVIGIITIALSIGGLVVG
jgi:hypothetical protein